MALVFAGITGHSSALLPGLATSHLPILQPALNYKTHILKELNNSHPESVIILSPHGPLSSLGPTLNIQKEFKVDFSNFGDLATKFEVKGDSLLADDLLKASFPEFKLQACSQTLDYASAIPLVTLIGQLNFSVLPTYPCLTDNLTEHYNFGCWLGNYIRQSHQAIAVISSVALSHRLTRGSPGGFSHSGKWFDKQVINALKQNDWEILNAINPEVVADVQECGLYNIVIMMGIMSNFEDKFKLLGYEQPVGVGWLYGIYQ
ncbi:hypothetical protein COT94_04270 [Candidatus Falkowbacteria bacterium CG10_big_fil_rev_8_21_14_0_10_37_14]|uniref:Extradiol ring-cleavage dioxygenase class III enzyme subunit B domain-containing protein n=1 Tax=Candidatus Falkowbacteria bacterium CG10_big_fil_rev_8_21_14_0_10_37_14 TaxID=1974561 RepID=A0A2M6WSI5_9BACT|nr:hypothetical protein [Candidatus Falkowbacteria bacterium]PIT95773.1 MAG: hypothetical protein COT94_04270 [Candidatus Falkowbacteria bacterium CG10_big_fil_rev_8_21_14_0_10_37_14]